LGNPGERYRDTRHNVGFRVVEELARRHGARLDALECNARVGAFPGIARADPADAAPPGVLLAQPQTYMNRSGYAARCLAERHGFAPPDLLVVFDDVHLPLGRLRLRRSGSPGGHRGMESVVENLQSDDVPRLRLGVAAEGGEPSGGDELVDFVLAPFTADERPAVDEMITRAADACGAWLAQGIEAAMNAFNR
jgi:PTH1 family peptidyl-tRNA hydrolase